MQRRTLLTGLIAIAGTRAFGATGTFEVTRTDAEWRAMLTELEFAVMRDHATERPFSSPLDKETRAGTYYCKGCDLPLYGAAQKYDSGTGWPSFWDNLPGSVGTQPDNTLFTTRTEVHCRRCGSHLGHIFNDGPQPTGKRHCLNGVSLVLKA